MVLWDARRPRRRVEGARLAETVTPDLCVIGAGLGGLAAATEARRLGATVVLVERDRLGGDYLNTGLVPSRALAAAAAAAAAMRNAAPFGVAAEEPRVNIRKIHDGVEQVVAALAPAEAQPRLEALGIQVVMAEGSFLDPATVAAGDLHIKARRFIVATGTRPVVPLIGGLDGVPHFTTETIFDNTRKLTHLAIIGAGPLGAGALGLELAQSYARLGSAVTVLESGAPLPHSDPELAAVALQRMREEGVDIRENAAVAEIQPRSQGIGVLVRAGGREELLDVSHILAIGGFAPDIEALNLRNAGVRFRRDDPRQVELSRTRRSTNRRVFVIGGAAGSGRGGHAAAIEARAAIRTALFELPLPPDTALAPRIAFTDPEIAEVGLTEAEARQRHGDRFRILRQSFAGNARARATRQSYGLAKVLVGPAGRIIGAGIAGDRAGELIAPFSLAIANRLTARHLADFLPARGTLSEIVQQAGTEYFRDTAVEPLMQRLVSLMRYIP